MLRGDSLETSGVVSRSDVQTTSRAAWRDWAQLSAIGTAAPVRAGRGQPGVLGRDRFPNGAREVFDANESRILSYRHDCKNRNKNKNTVNY